MSGGEPYMAGMPVAARYERAVVVRPGEKGFVEPLIVTSGASRLTIQISTASDDGADLDLYLFKVDAKRQLERRSATSTQYLFHASQRVGTNDEVINIDNPVAGHYMIVMNSEPKSMNPVSAVLVTEFTHADFGQVQVHDLLAVRRSGERWTAPYSIKRGTRRPENGYSLTGYVGVYENPKAVEDAESEKNSARKAFKLWKTSPKLIGRIAIAIRRAAL